MMEDFLNQIKNIASTLKTDNIIVLGKGVSVDSVDLAALSKFFIIGINDAERIIPCDVSVFHEEWVVKSLEDNHFNSEHYITSVDFQSSKRINKILTGYSPIQQNEIDVMVGSLVRNLDDAIFNLDEILFFSALKISRYLSKFTEKKLNVYMIGFDFDTSSGYSKYINVDYSVNKNDLKESRINPQEHYFLNALYMLKDSELSINHVGYKNYSSISPEDFNNKFLPLQPFNQPQTSQYEILITAELTTNHFGDRKRLEKMVRLAHSSGANYIKVQKRDIYTIYSHEQLNSKYISPFGTTFEDYRKQLELDYDDFIFLDNLCKKLNIEWFTSVLDKVSLDFILQFDPKIIKIPSTISDHKDYIEYVANNFNGEIVLSTGMTDIKYEKWVLETFKNVEKVYLMHTNSAYPTPDSDCNVSVVRHYHDLSKKYKNVIPAYSSHDNGHYGSSLAIAAGAKMIEKHVKLGNTEWAHFDAVALDLMTDEFSEYIGELRKTEIILGSGEKRVNKSENHKYLRKI